MAKARERITSRKYQRSATLTPAIAALAEEQSDRPSGVKTLAMV